MKDFQGNELKVGDKVLYVTTHYHEPFMRRGTITEVKNHIYPGGYCCDYVTIQGHDTNRTVTRIDASTSTWRTQNILKYEW